MGRKGQLFPGGHRSQEIVSSKSAVFLRLDMGQEARLLASTSPRIAIWDQPCPRK